MFLTIVTITAVTLLLGLAALTISKSRTATSAAFSFAALLLALIEAADYLSLNLSYDPFLFKKAAIFLESLLPLTFLFFSLVYSREGSAKPVLVPWGILMAAAAIFPASVFMIPLSNFFYSPDFPFERILFLGNAGYWFYLGMMLYCVLALLNIEATFSASSGSNRWKMKFDVIGISAVLAVLIFYFSQGLLYRTINMNLMPVRSGVLIIGSVLIGYSKLFRGNNVKLAVSRYFLYRSLTLTVVGLYLLTLGLIGEGLRYFGVSFSRDLTIFIAFTTGIAMLLVLFSEQLRRRIKVIINKHFYRHKHDYRDEWLKFTGRLALCKTIAEAEDVILTTYMETFGLKGATLYLFNRENKKYSRRANHNLPNTEIKLSADTPLILHFKEKGRVFNLFDKEYTPMEEEALFIQQAGAQQIVPLLENNSIEGFIVLGEQLAHDEFNYEDYDLMKTFARQAILSIMNMRLSEELAETREIAAVARISSFVMHDLKNLASGLSLLLDNAEDYMEDPDFQKDMIETVRKTVAKMKNLINKLKTIPEKQSLNLETADINEVVQETIEDTIKLRPNVEFLFEGKSAFSMVDREELKKVVFNLVLNAIEAAGENNKITIESGYNGMSYISVKDNGCGMTEDFIKNHLFKPFRTTKGKGLGIGLYQCKQIIDAHGGRIEVKSEAGKGSVFTAYLPNVKDMAIISK